MSRCRVPRRFAATLASAIAALCAAAPAFGQDAQHEPGGRTVIAGPGGRQIDICNRAAATGDVSDQGVAACTGALQRALGPDRVALLTNRGILYLRRHQADLALADVDAALAQQPQNPQVLLNRGSILLQMRNPGAAVAAFTQSLSLGVAQPYKAYYNRGMARESLGDLRGALEDYNTALQIQPDWGPAEAEISRFVRGRQQRLAGMLADPSAPPQN